MRRSHLLFALPVAMAALATSGAALAQSNETALDVERFKPALTHDPFVMTEGSAVREPENRWNLALWLNYGINPLVVVDETGALTDRYVGGRLGVDLIGSVTIAGPFAVGVGVPFFLAQTGDASPSFAGLGDVRLAPKIRILDDRKSIGLGLVAELRLPTHVGDYSGGARMVVFAPRIVVDHRFGTSGLRFGLNAGVLLREGTRFANVDAASEVTYSGALAYRIGGSQGKVELGLEAAGAVGMVAIDPEEVPLEALAFVKANPSKQWEIGGGAGMGIIPGYGVPTARFFAGVRWTPTTEDADHDGIPDDKDKCPNDPEDKDGDVDTDGCPEEDRDDDRDGVPNAEDRCPNKKEVINGVFDEDGCPDEGQQRVIYQDGKLTMLDNVQFKIGSAQIDPKSFKLLDQVALVLKANPQIKEISVEGHTDETGDREQNVTLSKMRAQSVRDYLVRKGVSPTRLSTEGYGPDKPLVQGTDAASRAKNRRVEFVLKE
jgi:outer membrane protein OmpA-like peptidoglycan-associated protein